ncbi:hypothetical protein [Algoriphagus sp.]|uniref:hypothetical protein n=1 Tax=Algoriphagus sp. TaxID=1872435 RepID=UPI0025C3889E|nr:hypothetical protein [Algoriphagus sp.]
MAIKLAIAEDNSFLLKAVKEKISFYPELNLKFHAFNGEELLKKLEEDSNVQLILMDIEMPKWMG